MANQTTYIKGAYLDRRLVEEDEEELMAAQGDDHLLKLLVDCIASRNIAYEEYDNDGEYNYDVMEYYDEDGNDYARDIERFEYEMAARSWIPEDEDYDYDDDYDDNDWDDYDYE